MNRLLSIVFVVTCVILNNFDSYGSPVRRTVRRFTQSSKPLSKQFSSKTHYFCTKFPYSTQTHKNRFNLMRYPWARRTAFGVGAGIAGYALSPQIHMEGDPSLLSPEDSEYLYANGLLHRLFRKSGAIHVIDQFRDGFFASEFYLRVLNRILDKAPNDNVKQYILNYALSNLANKETHTITDYHDVVRTLLEMGADPNSEVKGKKLTLIEALKGSDEETIRILIELGADPFKNNLEPLIFAINTDTQKLELLLKSMSNLNISISNHDFQSLMQYVESMGNTIDEQQKKNILIKWLKIHPQEKRNS